VGTQIAMISQFTGIVVVFLKYVLYNSSLHIKCVEIKLRNRNRNELH